MNFNNAAGNKYQLNPTSIGSGGEGDIFPVQGIRNTVAKIYKPGAMTTELEEKLKVMVQNPPNAAVFSQVAWPMDVLYDNGGQCRGFVMPRLNITHELGEIYKYPSRLPLSSLQKVNIAQNICVVISEVHKAGYVFGDFNPRNIGLDINTGLVSFLDTDTYHVYDKNKGITHRCNVCAPGYAAPELLERCSEHVAKHPGSSKHAYAKTPLPTFTQETDNFALAIHIFKLLMNGYTPFGGIIESASVSQSSPGVGDAAVKRDSYCFKPGFKHQSAAILPLGAFPPEIADLFTRAFLFGKIDPHQRPHAEEWHTALTKLVPNMTVCLSNSLHYYFNWNRTCPLCDADERFAEATGLSQIVYVNPSSHLYEEYDEDEEYEEYEEHEDYYDSEILPNVQKSKSKLFHYLMGTAAGTAFVSFITVLLLVSWHNGENDVIGRTPNLIGLSIFEAWNMANSYGFDIQLVGSEHHPYHPFDYVIYQEPPSNSLLAQGTLIRVTLSLGQEQVVMENVIGQPGSDVYAMFRAMAHMDFGIWIIQEYSDDVPMGHIIFQSPPPGFPLVHGSDILLHVSLGPAPTVVFHPVIPPGGYRMHVVEPGQSLASIAQIYWPHDPETHVGRQIRTQLITHLAETNNILSLADFFVGQWLRIYEHPTIEQVFD